MLTVESGSSEAVPPDELPNKPLKTWRALRLGALWGNLLYVGCFLVAMGVLMGLGPAPWRAYANVLVFLVISAGTPLLNVKAARAGLTAVASGFAIVLNLVCLGYFVLEPEYSVSALRLLVVVVPLLNVVVIVSRRGSSGGESSRSYNRDA